MTGWPNTSPPSIPPLRSSASTGSGYFAVITYLCQTRNHWYPKRLTIWQFAILSDSPPLILAATTRREECGKIISQQSTPSSSLSTLVIGDKLKEMRYHLSCCWIHMPTTNVHLSNVIFCSGLDSKSPSASWSPCWQTSSSQTVLFLFSATRSTGDHGASKVIFVNLLLDSNKELFMLP